MANMLIDSIKKIRGDYAGQLQDSINAAGQQTAAAKLPYDYNIGQAGKTYKPKINK